LIPFKVHPSFPKSSKYFARRLLPAAFNGDKKKRRIKAKPRSANVSEALPWSIKVVSGAY
jgi:hypothetical protein